MRRLACFALLPCSRMVAAHVGWLAAASVLSSAQAVPVQYNYTGNPFTSVSCNNAGFGPPCTPLFTTSDRLTGYVIIDGGLPASSVVATNANTVTVRAFSFTDGVSTISSSNPDALILAGFQTNVSGQIVNATIGATLATTPSGLYALGMGTSNNGDQSSYGATDPVLGIGNANFASNTAPGTWTQAATPLQPTFQLQFAVRHGDSVPNDTIVALATAFNGSTPISLATAASELGVDHFNWRQTIITHPTLVMCAGRSFSVFGTESCNQSTDDSGMVPRLPTPDAPKGGWRGTSSTFPTADYYDTYLDEYFTSPGGKPWRIQYQTTDTTIPTQVDLEANGGVPLSSAYGLYFSDQPSFLDLGRAIFEDRLVGVKGNCQNLSRDPSCTSVPIDLSFRWFDTSGAITAGPIYNLSTEKIDNLVYLGTAGGTVGNITVFPITLAEALAGEMQNVPEPGSLFLLGPFLLIIIELRRRNEMVCRIIGH